MVTSEGFVSGLSAGEQSVPADAGRDPEKPPQPHPPALDPKKILLPPELHISHRTTASSSPLKVNFRPRAVVVGFAFLQFRAGRPESSRSRDFFDASSDATGKMFSASSRAHCIAATLPSHSRAGNGPPGEPLLLGGPSLLRHVLCWVSEGTGGGREETPRGFLLAMAARPTLLGHHSPRLLAAFTRVPQRRGSKFPDMMMRSQFLLEEPWWWCLESCPGTPSRGSSERNVSIAGLTDLGRSQDVASPSPSAKLTYLNGRISFLWSLDACSRAVNSL